MWYISVLITTTITHNRSPQTDLSTNGIDNTGMVLQVLQVLYLFHYHYFVADAEEIPYHTKFLLIASFLASYNKAKTDERYFSEVYIVFYYISLHVIL